MTVSRFVSLVLLALLLCAGLLAGIAFVSTPNPRFRDFADRRTNWMARCRVYVGRVVDTPDAHRCAADLVALLAEAEREGWTRRQ